MAVQAAAEEKVLAGENRAVEHVADAPTILPGVACRRSRAKKAKAT